MKQLFLSLLCVFLGLVDIHAGNSNIDSLQKIIKKESGAKKIEAQILLSQAIYDRSSASAIALGFNAFLQSKKIANNELYVKAIVSLATLYQKTSRFDSALVLYRQALEVNKTEDGLVEIIDNIGVSYREIGKYDSALLYHIQSLKICETTGEKKGIALSLNYIGNVFIRNGSYDSALVYYNKSLKIRQENHLTEDVAASFENIGEVYKKRNQYDKALDYLTNALFLRQKIGNKSKTAYCYNSIGNFYLQLKIYDKAREYYSKSLDLRVELGDKKDIASTYNNIGTLHRELQNYDKALEYLQKALFLRQQTGDNEAIAMSYNSIGALYWSKKDYDKAIDNYKRALQIRQKLGEQIQIAATIKNLGIIYKDMNDFQTALDYYQQSLQIYILVKDFNGIASIQNLKGNLYKKSKEPQKSLEFYTNAYEIYKQINQSKDIALLANNLAEIYTSLGQKDKAIKFYKEAYTLAETIKDKETAKDAAFGLSEVYKSMKNYEKSLEFFTYYSALKDSIQNDMNKKRIAEIEFENAIKSKDNEISNQQYKIKSAEAEITKIRTYIFGVIMIIVLIIIFVILVLIQFSQKKKAFELLAQKSSQLEDAFHELAQINRELAIKNDQITDSITYAKQIQEAILPSEELFSYHFPNHFIFYKPKEIVSGDFYWFTAHGDCKYLAVVDCTGHGVPGAFMSMIGNTLLNEIINVQKLDSTAEILQKLDAGVISALKQNTSSDKRQEDGMDVTLCKIDTGKGIVEVSTANHRMVVIKNNELSTIDGDGYSIGGMYKIKQRKNARYTSQILPIEKGMKLYLHSDGIIDQFGGRDNERFKTPNFHKLLIQTQQNDMHEQYLAISQHFETWKGAGKQLDDVLVVGIEL